MTRLEAKRIIDLYPIIEAFANGAEIEFYDSEYDSWQVLEEPSFDSDMADYRIKQQEYRSFKDIDECMAEMLKHDPFGWVKDRFDPKTLQPFDRVLARYNKSCRWKALFFSHCYMTQDNENIYVCDSAEYMYCIPFDDDTKHLVGTKDEAPEYYRYWED